MAWLKIVHTENDGRYRDEFNLHWMSMKWSSPLSPIVAKLHARCTYLILTIRYSDKLENQAGTLIEHVISD
jgi:hypothetical protein